MDDAYNSLTILSVVTASSSRSIPTPHEDNERTMKELYVENRFLAPKN